MPGVIKLVHLQHLEPILLTAFFKFFNFHAGRPIVITPERGRLKMGKGNSPNLSALGAWGIQVGSFATLRANLVDQIFEIFHFHTGRPILITPERGRLKMGKGKSPNLSGLGAWGIQVGTFAAL